MVNILVKLRLMSICPILLKINVSSIQSNGCSLKKTIYNQLYITLYHYLIINNINEHNSTCEFDYLRN